MSFLQRALRSVNSAVLSSKQSAWLVTRFLYAAAAAWSRLGPG